MPGATQERTFFRDFLRYWLPALAYVTLIITLSAQPHLRPPLDFRFSDKLAHLLEYGVLGVLLVRALHGSMGLPLALGTALLAILLGALIGAGDEYLQSFVPGRESSALDWLADVTGVALAQIAYRVTVKR